MLRTLAILILAFASAPHAMAQNDLQRAQNLVTCLGGRYPALCKKVWLSQEERAKVDVAERRENLNLCLQGRYPGLCNRALLTQNERTEVQTAEKRENLRICLTGKYRTLCNPALLNPEERSSVKAAESQENLRVCLTGKYPTLCEKSLLNREQTQQVQVAEAQARTLKPLRSSAAGRARSRSGGSDCESGHWVESVSDDGQVVKLEDGSIWQVNAVDAIDSMLWLPTTDIVACEDKLINTEDNESVSARRLR